MRASNAAIGIHAKKAKRGKNFKEHTWIPNGDTGSGRAV